MLKKVFFFAKKITKHCEKEETQLIKARWAIHLIVHLTKQSKKVNTKKNYEKAKKENQMCAHK